MVIMSNLSSDAEKSFTALDVLIRTIFSFIWKHCRHEWYSHIYVHYIALRNHAMQPPFIYMQMHLI